LLGAEIGDYLIRPSSAGEDWLTLSWKFFDNIVVHQNIQEADKLPGTNIGSKFIIGSESYESLQEINDRYMRECTKKVLET
jgi:transcription elongation factor SPT6